MVVHEIRIGLRHRFCRNARLDVGLCLVCNRLRALVELLQVAGRLDVRLLDGRLQRVDLLDPVDHALHLGIDLLDD